MPRYIILALLLALAPALAMAQSSSRRVKGPLYKDDVLLVQKNMIAARLPVGFYLYNYAVKTYEGQTTPLLIGIRYEHLFRSIIGAGIEIEHNSWDARPLSPTDTLAYDVPPDQKATKISPYIRFYFRKEKKRKYVFRGPYVGFGPTLLNITSSYDANKDDYGQATPLGFSAYFGFQHTIGNYLLVGGSVEAIALPESFIQAGYYRVKMGDGSVQINPFKFYFGIRF